MTSFLTMANTKCTELVVPTIWPPLPKKWHQIILIKVSRILIFFKQGSHIEAWKWSQMSKNPYQEQNCRNWSCRVKKGKSWYSWSSARQFNGVRFHETKNKCTWEFALCYKIEVTSYQNVETVSFQILQSLFMHIALKINAWRHGVYCQIRSRDELHACNHDERPSI